MQTPAGQAMPKYKSHKEVHALPIASVAPIKGKRGHSTMTFEGSYYVPVEVSNDLFKRYEPKPGDYYVVYSDGYQSISPKKAFEEGYTRA